MTCYLCAVCVMKYSFMFCWNGVRVERVVKEGGGREEMKKKEDWEEGYVRIRRMQKKEGDGEKKRDGKRMN